MARSKSSQRWLREHFADPYVKQAQRDGYRARAAYKLLEIQTRDKLLQPGQIVVDLGAAPGSWAQVAAPIVGKRGRIVAVDILPMEPLPGVEFLQGDFTEASVLAQLQQTLAGAQVNLVLSDMSPNISGIESADQSRAALLAELAWEFAAQHLVVGGDFLFKAFQGADLESLLRTIRPRFSRFLVRKPAASRARSRELYLLARGYKPARCVNISAINESKFASSVLEGE